MLEKLQVVERVPYTRIRISPEIIRRKHAQGKVTWSKLVELGLENLESKKGVDNADDNGK